MITHLFSQPPNGTTCLFINVSFIQQSVAKRKLGYFLRLFSGESELISGGRSTEEAAGEDLRAH